MSRKIYAQLAGATLAGAMLLGACTSNTTVPLPPAPTAPASETSSPVDASPTSSGADFTFTTPPTGKMQTYTDTELGFAIDYPKRWDEVTRGETCQKGAICFQAPKQQGFVPAMIMVSVYKDQQNLENLSTGWNTLRQLTIDSWGASAKTVTGTAGDTELAGLPAKTATYDVSAAFVDYKMTQTMTMNDKIEYYAVSVGSTTDTWDSLESTFKDATDSFTLT